jgi:hypothetical protein
MPRPLSHDELTPLLMVMRMNPGASLGILSRAIGASRSKVLGRIHCLARLGEAAKRADLEAADSGAEAGASTAPGLGSGGRRFGVPAVDPERQFLPAASD